MNPIIADNKPVAVSLKKGEEYYFCVCGKSGNQPFCDGSHAGTGLSHKAFIAEEEGAAHLCQCKHSNNQPFCDGSHAQFGSEQIGKEGPGLVSSVGSAPVAKATVEEPTVVQIHQLARDGLSKVGHHGTTAPRHHGTTAP